jgi:regulator of sigma E protease
MVKEKTILDEDLTVPKIGVILGGQTVILRFPPGEAVTMAGANTGQLLRLISKVLVKMVKGELSLRKALSGPIRMAKIAGDQAREGAVNFLGILASLSINLGYLNLLPIPVLDGGHIAFTLWEIVFRRPVSPRAREIAQQVGLAIIVTLMFFAFYNDIFWLFTGK